MFKPNLTYHLEAILTDSNKSNCYFVGGSLCIDNPNGKKGFFLIPPPLSADKKAMLYEEDWEIEFKLNEQQKKLFAQIYVKHKTENHHYYQEMKEICDAS